MKNVNIAIDGPSGAGKSTLAKMMAAELGYIYVDTGAMYRAIGLYVLRKGICTDDHESIVHCLSNIKTDIRYVDGEQRVLLNGEDVSCAIRTEAVSRYASAVSALPEVRQFLLEAQRTLAASNNVIMDGRDIGTVILPHADIKIFLTADAEDRAQRRYAELLERGQQADFESVLANIKERDKNDAERAVAPLRQAEDAFLINTTGCSLEESAELLRRVIRERMPNV